MCWRTYFGHDFIGIVDEAVAQRQNGVDLVGVHEMCSDGVESIHVVHGLDFLQNYETFLIFACQSSKLSL